MGWYKKEAITCDFADKCFSRSGLLAEWLDLGANLAIEIVQMAVILDVVHKAEN